VEERRERDRETKNGTTPNRVPRKTRPAPRRSWTSGRWREARKSAPSPSIMYATITHQLAAGAPLIRARSRSLSVDQATVAT
jgi:hypothetical protein